MSGPVLSTAGLGKCYLSYASLTARLGSWLGFRIQPVAEFWAVRDVSFAVAAGEAVALIGENGSGKSTVLKLITGTVRPTTGDLAVNGRVGAILELGIGFNADLSGRENVLQSGGMMGLAPAALASMLPDIEAFAELGSFFDEPLRIYSSGMQARLAFALATAVPTDILIVDEVLSVGDSYFQHKSFNRIRALKEAGCAILFVSHNMADVRALCDRVLMIARGRIVKDGTPDEVVDFYNAAIAEKEHARGFIEQHRLPTGWMKTRSGTGQAVVRRVELLDGVSRTAVETARVGQPLVLRLTVEAERAVERLVVGVMLRDRTGHVVWGTNTWHLGRVAEAVGAGERLGFEFAFECRLGIGSYAITTSLSSTDTHLLDNYDWQDSALVFDVVNVGRSHFIGSSWLPVDCTVDRDGDGEPRRVPEDRGAA